MTLTQIVPDKPTNVFPQYARSTNPAVIEAVEANRIGLRAFRKRALAFAIAQGVEKGTYYPSSFAGSHRVRAVGGDERPSTGKWKQGYGGYGWLPYKTNPLSAELDALKFDEQDVPGLPSLVDGPYAPCGGHTIATPRPFVHYGAAYVGFSFIPIDPGHTSARPRPEDGGWVEIKASEYHLAVEAYNEAVAAEVSS